MRAVVQRVKWARLSIGGETVSEIEQGLVVYLCAMQGDVQSDADYFVSKLPSLRIFSDEQGKLNLSAASCGYELMIVSQFTLAGETSHGNRPSFTTAMEPIRAKAMYEYVCDSIESAGTAVKRGVFGADMTIEQSNDGPVTIVMSSNNN